MKYIKERTLGERFKTSWFSRVLPSSVIDTVKGVVAVPDAYAKVEAASFIIDVLSGRTSLKTPSDKEKVYLAHLKSGDLGKTGDKAVKFAEETTSINRMFEDRLARRSP